MMRMKWGWQTDRVPHVRRCEGISRQLQIGENPSASRFDSQVFPIYPGEPGGQVARVPLRRLRGPDFASEASVNVGKGFHGLGVVQDLPQKRDVGDGQPQGVDFAEPFLVRKRRYVLTELVKCGVDA